MLCYSIVVSPVHNEVSMCLSNKWMFRSHVFYIPHTRWY